MRTAASRSCSSTPPAGSVSARSLLALLLPLAAGCGEETAPPQAEASPRFAALSRFILFRPASGELRPFFLDRFESTRGDFAVEYAWRREDLPAIVRELWVAGDLAGSDEWPAVGMTLREALDHAAWRFGRLPTFREWQYAVGGDSNPPYMFPWGDHFEDFRSNTASLGLLRPTAVGTFEPGRYASGADTCYDLVGNVAELTVEPHALAPPRPRAGSPRGFGGLLATFLRLNRELANRLALAIGRPEAYWSLPPEPGHGVHAVGWHFMARVPDDRSDLRTQWAHGATERSTYVGMRVATDPETLIAALFACEDPLNPEDERLVARFAARHRGLLRSIVAELPPGQATGAVERVVREALR